MRLATTFLPLLLLLSVAGCFTSNRPLIKPTAAVFPFASFTYGEKGSDDRTTFVRKADVYVLQPTQEGRTLELTFRRLPSGHYLAQMKGDTKTGIVYLYAMLKVDFAARTAAAYKVAADKSDVRAGLRSCPERTVCIDDLAAYIALGEATIAAGGEPDVVYDFTAAK